MTPETRHTPFSFVIATGDELVRGEVEDRNGPWLARALAVLGFSAAEIRLLPDDAMALEGALAAAHAAGAALVIVTGGLGPTEDDRTRDAIARHAGRALVCDPRLETALLAFHRARGRPFTPASRRQACLPEGATPLDNPSGTAPGFFLDAGGMRIVALPGPPAEMRDTAREDLSALAGALPGGGQPPRVLRLDTFGLPEADVDLLLDGTRAIEGVRVGTLAGGGTVSVVLLAVGDGAAEALARARASVEEALGRHVFGEGGASLASSVIALLRARGWTLAVAESCTGGLVGHLLTEVPGASAVLREGVVAYSNEAKVRRLAVPEALLSSAGAVSPEVAAAMAKGAATAAAADAGIGITGIAGPGGGSAEKPVGLVFVAVSAGGRETVRRLDLSGMNRRWIKRISAFSALDLLRRTIATSGEHTP